MGQKNKERDDLLKEIKLSVLRRELSRAKELFAKLEKDTIEDQGQLSGDVLDLGIDIYSLIIRCNLKSAKSDSSEGCEFHGHYIGLGQSLGDLKDAVDKITLLFLRKSAAE